MASWIKRVNGVWRGISQGQSKTRRGRDESGCAPNTIAAVHCASHLGEYGLRLRNVCRGRHSRPGGVGDTELGEDIEYGDLAFMADADLSEVQASMTNAAFLHGRTVHNEKDEIITEVY